MGRMEAKPSMKGSFVTYSLEDGAIIIYRYNSGSNCFFDSSDKALEKAGYAIKRGNRYYECTKEEYEEWWRVYENRKQYELAA